MSEFNAITGVGIIKNNRHLTRAAFILLFATIYISASLMGCTYFYSGGNNSGGQLPAKIPKYKSFSNPADGYSISVPADMKIDKSYGDMFMKLYSDSLELRISREVSPYPDLKEYLNVYLYKYIFDYSYREANKITLYSDGYKKINSYDARLVSFGREAPKGSSAKENQYLHAHIFIGERVFYTFSFKAASIVEQRAEIDRILASFKVIPQQGSNSFMLSLKPELPKWNAETAEFYKKLSSSKTVMWGLFYPHTITEDFTYIDNIEKKLGFKFPLTLHYLYLGREFPKEGMEKAYQRGKVVELTMQIMYDVRDNGNSNRKHNVNFDVLDGMYDDYIRQFARDAKTFGHPFIFRLNNEMNTTWTRYSGIAMMCDPDNFIESWHRIYDIFQQEGVDNAIWVFNPNDRDYPPFSWNSQIAYYPGNRYVQMIGLTGYNTGTYYIKKTDERWRTFRQIYDPLSENYSKYYGSFPWMITEFACSSTGGDKTKWIEDMFKNMGRYPNLKAAVWWSYADFDYSTDKKGIPARRYWLDEKDEYLQAFKKGVKGANP